MSWGKKPSGFSEVQASRAPVNAARDIHHVDPLLSRGPAEPPAVVVIGGVTLVRATDLEWRAKKPRTNPEANKKAERLADERMERHESEMRANGWALTAKLGSHLSVWKKGDAYGMVLPSGLEDL